MTEANSKTLVAWLAARPEAQRDGLQSGFLCIPTLKREKLLNFKINVIKKKLPGCFLSDGANRACFLGLGVLITHLQLPQFPWACTIDQGCSPCSCLPPPAFAKGWVLPVLPSGRGGLPTCVSPLPFPLELKTTWTSVLLSDLTERSDRLKGY